MEIRKAVAADFGFVSVLNAEVQSLHARHEPALFKPVAELTPELFGKWIANSDLGLFVGHRGCDPVGYLFCEIWRQAETPFAHACASVYLRHIGVRRSERGKGYGRALLDGVRAFARENDIACIELDCWAFNREGLAFFRRSGFATMRERLALGL